MTVRTVSEQGQRAGRDRDKVLRPEDIFMDAELAGSAEIDRHEAVQDVLDLPDAVIRGLRSVVHELPLAQFTMPARLAVEGRDDREQF